MPNRIVGSLLTLELQLDILLRIVRMPYPNHGTVDTHFIAIIAANPLPLPASQLVSGFLEFKPVR